MALQDCINILKSDGRMWNPAIAVKLFLSAFHREIDLVLFTGKGKY